VSIRIGGVKYEDKGLPEFIGEELWGQAYTFDKVECVHSGMQKGGLEIRKGKKIRQNL